MSEDKNFSCAYNYQEYMCNYFKNSKKEYNYNAIYIGYMYSLKLFYQYYIDLHSNDEYEEYEEFKDFSINNKFKSFLITKIDNAVIMDLFKNIETEDDEFEASYLLSDEDTFNYILRYVIEFLLGCTLNFPGGFTLPTEDEELLNNLLIERQNLERYYGIYEDETNESSTYVSFETNKLLKDIDSNITFRAKDTNNSM